MKTLVIYFLFILVIVSCKRDSSITNTNSQLSYVGSYASRFTTAQLDYTGVLKVTNYTTYGYGSCLLICGTTLTDSIIAFTNADKTFDALQLNGIVTVGHFTADSIYISQHAANPNSGPQPWVEVKGKKQ